MRILYYNDDINSAFRKACDEICALNKDAQVLVLGRYNSDKDKIAMALFDFKRNAKMKLEFKTVHKSKGLEAEFVILLNGDGGIGGFPNGIEDDKLLELVLGKKDEYPHAEERRLFYVALTRTRKIVYVLANQNNPSIFVKEIDSTINATDTNSNAITCPHCEGKLKLRNADKQNPFYGCEYYPYCDYKIFNIDSVLWDLNCPDCGDYLRVKNGRYGKFIGCNGYPQCRYTSDLDDDLEV